jgi:ABC-type multidrug transport system fused ATPase/permease subunit
MGISESIKSFRGSTTVIVIAHRLSTIKDADSVVYFENGRIRAEGTFEEVSRAVPEFDIHSKTRSE